jgi:hypothetical protein
MEIFNFFISNFKNEKFIQFSFQIFVAYFKILQFPFGAMAKIFQISKSIFLLNSPFPSGGMAKFFKIKKQKNSIQISNFFFHFSFQIFLAA